MRALHLLISVALVVAASGTVAAEPARPWQREPLRLALERWIGWNLGADVTIDALEGPLVPEIVLRGVTVDVRGERLATIDSFRARVDAWALFRADDALIELIELRRAVFTVTRGADGRFNVPERGDSQQEVAAEEAKESRWLSMLGIEMIRLGDGLVHVRDRDANLDLNLGVELEGHNITLPWKVPENRKTSGRLQLALQPSTLGGERIASGSLTISLAGGKLTFADSSARTSFGALGLEGNLDVSQPSSWPSGRLALLGSEISAGALTLGELKAEFESPGDGTLHIGGLELSGGDLPLQVKPGSTLRLLEGKGKGVSFERFTAYVGDQPIQLSGSIDTERFDAWRVNAKGFDAAIAARLLGSPVPLSGPVDFTLALDGPGPAPVVAGSARWTKPRVSHVEIEGAEVTLHSRDGELLVEVAARESDREILIGNAILPWDGTGPEEILHSPLTRVELRGNDIELALFEPFLARHLRDLRGRAEIMLTLRGDQPQPHLLGSVDIAGGSVRVPLLQRTFGPVDGSLTLDGESIVLDALRIGTADGFALAGGRVGQNQLAADFVDLKLTLQTFPLSRSSLLRADLAGNLAVTGPLNALAARGELELQNTSIRLPEAEDPLLREIQVVYTAADSEASREIVEGAAEPDLFEAAALDLSLQLPRGTRVKGSGTNLDLTGELKLTKGAMEEPRYAGRVEVVRGTWTFKGRRFSIRRGSADFDGGTEPNPLIEIEAEYRVRDVTILAFLTGRALDPILRLESEPALPESEVFHYLVFGRPSESEAEPDSSQLGEAAGALAAGVALSQVLPMVEEALPIDTLEVNIPKDGSGATIGVGTYLHENVYVRYGRTLSRDPIDEIRIELRLDEHWSIESQASSDDNAGADLIWSLDF